MGDAEKLMAAPRCCCSIMQLLFILCTCHPFRPTFHYCRSKLEAEQYLAAEWPRHVCLRCSIICGPSPRVPVGRPLFLQFVQSKLAAGEATSFFEDEFR